MRTITYTYDEKHPTNRDYLVAVLADAIDDGGSAYESVENGELEAYSRDRKRMCELPPAQPEPTDINAKEAVYNLAEKIGIHQLFALTVELRGEPIQPEPAIPLSWIEKYIEWLKSFDNEFANLEAAHISVMLKKWRDEQNDNKGTY